MDPSICHSDLKDESPKHISAPFSGHQTAESWPGDL